MLFLKLGHKDSNLENDGVRVRCLTIWRWPNEITICIILREMGDVKPFYEKNIKAKIFKFLCMMKRFIEP